MDVPTIIDRLGGSKAVQELTGLSKGRISQWRSGNKIPDTWIRVLRSERPDVMRQADTPKKAGRMSRRTKSSKAPPAKTPE